jgi:LysR family transcriptional regulator, transcriptional activator of the cysJI operon
MANPWYHEGEPVVVSLPDRRLFLPVFGRTAGTGKEGWSVHLDAMRYFLMIVEERSISKGAARAHISQSALSQTIQKLEEDLGYQLMLRSNRGITLTGAGEIVRRYAETLTRGYDRMLEELSLSTESQHFVGISGTYSLAAYSLPCMLYKIKKMFPKHQYSLDAKNAEDIIRDVREGLTDLGFVDIVLEEPESLVFSLMGKERVVLMAKADYPVADTLTVHDLFNIEMIMCTMNRKTTEHLDEVLHSVDRRLENLNVLFYADSLSAVKSSVLSGFGMAFVPYESIKHELYEKLIKLVTVEGINLDYDIYMVSRKPKDMPLPARVSRDYLLEVGVKSFC